MKASVRYPLIKISFWLIPAAADRVFFQETIKELANIYDAPAFTPHVTIYSGEYTPDESLVDLVKKVTQGVSRFSLNVDKLLFTDQFTKALFVQFYPQEILNQISETLRYSAAKPSNFTLNPHLSLIYQHLSETIKKDLTTSIHLPNSQVLFNEVSAVLTPQKLQAREDVESWKVICTRELQ